MSVFSFSQLKNYYIANRGKKLPWCKHEPVRICLFVTGRCTLSCKWCLRQSETGKDIISGSDMPLGQAKRILQYFPSATHLRFAGFGEPLLVDDVFKINAEFKKRPMRTSIITNGTLLLDRMDDMLHAEFNVVSISINSLDASEYKITCGGNEDTFGNVLKGIRVLAEKRRPAKTRIYLSFVLTRDLFSRTPEIIKLVEGTGADRLELHNLIPHGNYNDYTGVLTTDDEEVQTKLAEWKRKKYKVQVGWPKLVQKGLKKPARICKPLWDWIGVDMDGNLAGCPRAMGVDSEYGNLFREGKPAWNNEFRKNLRESFLIGDKFLYDCCKTCVEVQP